MEENKKDNIIKIETNISTYLKDSMIKTALIEAIDEKIGMISRPIYEAVLYSLIIINFTDYNIVPYGKITIVELYDKLEEEGTIEKVIEGICSTPEGKRSYDNFIGYANLAYDQAIDRMNSAAAGIRALFTELTVQGAKQAATQLLKDSENEQNIDDTNDKMN